MEDSSVLERMKTIAWLKVWTVSGLCFRAGGTFLPRENEQSGLKCLSEENYLLFLENSVEIASKSKPNQFLVDNTKLFEEFF